MVRLSDLPQAMADNFLQTPCPEFQDTPFVAPRPLKDRRVAIVATGGLQHLGEKIFTIGAGGYRVLSRTDPRPIVSTHTSANFDRTGMQEDLNVVFPLVRLDELAQEGVIGSVADFHYSFMGGTPPDLMEPYARKLAPLIKKDGVDTIFLLPSCPMCTRAVSGLAHYFEEEGLSTVAIALIRNFAERIKPPRALWVPFELGRPLGAPGDSVFQRKVILSAFELLNRQAGPVLEDFPEDAPADTQPDNGEGWACPISFGKLLDVNEIELGAHVRAEIDELAPWYDKSLARRRRTLVGASGLTLPQCVAFLAEFMDGTVPANPDNSRSLADHLRWTAEDVKSYYMEAAWAQPGQPKRNQIANWFWGETLAGRFLLLVCKKVGKSDDKSLARMASAQIVPIVQRHRFKSV